MSVTVNWRINKCHWSIMCSTTETLTSLKSFLNVFSLFVMQSNLSWVTIRYVQITHFSVKWKLDAVCEWWREPQYRDFWCYFQSPFQLHCTVSGGRLIQVWLYLNLDICLVNSCMLYLRALRASWKTDIVKWVLSLNKAFIIIIIIIKYA